jgi:predicted GH43/DUF377 family glycosyl hydrolase
VRRLIAAGRIPPAFARQYGVKPPATAARMPLAQLPRLACVSEGQIVERCGECGGAKDVFVCERYDVNATRAKSDKVKSCHGCGEFRPVEAAAVSAAKFDKASLYPEKPGIRFNPSMTPHRGGFAFLYRSGWQGSGIYAVQLAADLTPQSAPKKLRLRVQGHANYGKEDPRLFTHAGKLHVSYAGVVGKRYGTHVNQCFARLTDAFDTEDTFAPHYPDRNQWEKNWGFFDYKNDLFAVYTINPHCVLRVRSNDAELAYETPFPSRWEGGELRGGAAPVLHRGEFYSFFHDRIDAHGKPTYRMGVYTFAARPPFRVTRFCPSPILSADPRTNPDNYANVIFPGGAAVDRDSWLIAAGIHDRYCEILRIPLAEIERRLAKV